jgi:EAL and modified HD-GYP domain-containing signal transduction protein
LRYGTVACQGTTYALLPDRLEAVKKMLEDKPVEAANNIFIARQPIFRTNQKVYGYELLFRSSLANFFDPAEEGTRASSKVLTNSFLLFGISNISEGKKAFINFTEEMLCLEYPSLFPKEITVVEILENVNPTPELLAALRFLKRKGYTLALDDFTGIEEGREPILELVDIIKFDLRLVGMEALGRQVEALNSRYKVKILAEKVESFEEYEQAKKLGFDFFQGYFFQKPKVMAGRDIPGSKLQYLLILRQLQDENYTIKEVADLISHDVSLSYKLLKYVNSAYFGLRREIQSVDGAVAMVGEIDLKKWLNLVMLAYLAEDKPIELVRSSLLRAEFCDLLGRHLAGPGKTTGKFYTVGMFSLLDALLDKPMDAILNELTLSPDINDALLGRNPNFLMASLYLAKAYESGSWKTAVKLADKLGIEGDQLPMLYDKALAVIKRFDFQE